MAYTSQQIADAVQASLGQGFTMEQIMQGAQDKFGVSPYDVANAAMSANPSAYMQPDEIIGSVNPWSLEGSTANDPRYLARHSLLETAANLMPDPSASDLQNLMFSPTGAPMTAPAAPSGSASPMPSGQPAPGGGAGGSPSYGNFANWNPYMGLMGDDIQRRTNLGLQDAFNGIRSNAVGVGGLGGSRQGIAEGVATGRAMDSLQGNLGNVYGGLWEGAQNRGLSQYGIDTNAALTGRGQDIQNYNTNRSMDLQQLGLGANIYDMGVRGGWQPLQTASGIFNTTAGNNVTSTSGGTQGGGWQGLLGGALGAGQYARNMGWW